MSPAEKEIDRELVGNYADKPHIVRGLQPKLI